MSAYLPSPSMEECVAKGVAHLDKVKPYWFQLIDLDKLDMRLWKTCVLGQLFNISDFYIKNKQIFVDDLWKYGFNCGLYDIDKLTARWKEVILHRRNA